jgi:PKD repeat protein
MYLTPWVNKVAKPPAPLANFSVTADGTTVHFQNQSQPRGDGWWDFGDGSPLVPVSSDTEFLAHTYPRPGDYTVKLTIRNVLGEENDRSAPVHIDGAPTADKPRISSLEARPTHRGAQPGVVYAPATFCLESKVEHANLFVWDFGDERPCEVTTDAAKAKGLHVTFPRPGRYVVKLVAVNGMQHDERTTAVTVAEAPANSVALMLTVTDDAARVETADRQVNLGVTWPVEFTGASYPFERPFKAAPGYTIADVVIPPAAAGARQAQMGTQLAMTFDGAAAGLRSAKAIKFQLSDDRQKLTASGELIRQAGLTSLSTPLLLKQQRRVPVHQVNPVTATLTLPQPGATATAQVQLPPLPPDWTDSRRQVQFALRAGDQAVWQDSQLPRGSLVTVGGRRYLLTATVTGEQVRVDLTDSPAGLPPTAN